MKIRIQNIESRIQKGEARIEHGWHGFENEIVQEGMERTERRGRSGAHKVHALPAEGGKRRFRIVQFSRISRLFAPFPGISHLFPLHLILGNEANKTNGTNMAGSTLQCGIMRNKLRVVTHCYAKFHESSHRSGP